MADATRAIGVEEYQVPWLQLAYRSVFSQLILHICSTWYSKAVLLKNILDIAGAVKALWGGATGNVFYANIFKYIRCGQAFLKQFKT